MSLHMKIKLQVHDRHKLMTIDNDKLTMCLWVQFIFTRPLCISQTLTV